MNASDTIGGRIERLHEEIPAGVTLVAVSKFHPASAVMEAYEAGQRVFGESRVQEFLEKKRELPGDIKWHFIGHLQTNKVKSVIGQTHLIESVDSIRLLDLINKESEKAGVITELLLQVHVAAEETKFGFFPEELQAFFAERKYEGYGRVRIRGIMGMASNTDDSARIREDFKAIASIFRKVKELAPDPESFDILSMGMSGDWPLAIKEGSNMIRIGSAIFGQRIY